MSEGEVYIDERKVVFVIKLKKYIAGRNRSRDVEWSIYVYIEKAQKGVVESARCIIRSNDARAKDYRKALESL